MQTSILSVFKFQVLIGIIIFLFLLSSPAPVRAAAANVIGSLSPSSNWAAAGGAYGWACRLDNVKEDVTVSFYSSLPPEAGGDFVGSVANSAPWSTSSNLICPGRGNFGFNLSLAQLRDRLDGVQTLYAAAVTPQGTTVNLSGSPITYDFGGAVLGAVASPSSFSAAGGIYGYACEPGIPGQAMSVQLLMDGLPSYGNPPIATVKNTRYWAPANKSPCPGQSVIGYNFSFSSLKQIQGTHHFRVMAQNSKGHSVLIGEFAYTINPVSPKNVVSMVSNNQGAPTLMIHGKPSSGLGWGSMCSLPYDQKSWNNIFYGADGIQIARINLSLGDNITGYCNFKNQGPTWDGASKYDFTILKNLIDQRWTVNSNLKFVLQIAIDGSSNWVNNHPANQDPRNQGTGIPDYLSVEWQADVRIALIALWDYIVAHGYSDSIVALEVFGGATMDNNLPVSIGTPQAIARFRSFLSSKYHNNVTLLQRAWQDPQIQFTSALPHLARNEDAMKTFAPLVSPTVERPYFDTREFMAMSLDKIITSYANLMRAASFNQVAVGATSAGYIYSPWDNKEASTYHSPEFYGQLDFIDSWAHYDLPRHNGEVGGAVLPLAASDSLAQMGRLYFLQNDFRLAYGDGGNPPQGWDINLGDGYDADLALSIQKHRTALAFSLVNRQSEYLWEQAGYLHGQDSWKAEWRLHQDIFTRATLVDRSSVATPNGVALVTDSEMNRNFLDTFIASQIFPNDPYRQLNQAGTVNMMVEKPLQTLTRFGGALDQVSLNDLAIAPPYKLYIFYHTLSLTGDQISMIQKVLANNHANAIFIYADGVEEPNGPLLPGLLGARISRLVGMNVVGMTTPRWATLNPMSSFIDANKPENRNRWLFPTGRTWDNGAPLFMQLGPSFKIIPNVAQNEVAIATYQDSAPNAPDVAIAQKTFADGHFVIYSATPYVPPSVYRAAARQSGVWVANSSSEDHLAIDQSFIALRADQTGEVRLDLPSAQPLYEVFSGKSYESAGQQKIPVQANTTYLFFRGTATQWNGLMPSLKPAPVPPPNSDPNPPPIGIPPQPTW